MSIYIYKEEYITMSEEENQQIDSDEIKTDTPNQEVLQGTVSVAQNTSCTVGINIPEQTVTGCLNYSAKNLGISIETNTAITNKKTNLSISGNYNISEDSHEISSSVNITHNENGNTSGNIEGSVSINNGNTTVQANGSLYLDENETLSHNIDTAVQTSLGNTELSASLHNDRQDSNITITGKRPLLRRNNNPNSSDADYQEQKEGLEQSGDLFNISSKVGYSNEDAGFYTSNSLLANLGKDCFLNLKYDKSRFQDMGSLTAEIKDFDFSYSDEINKPRTEEDIKTRTQGIDVTLNRKNSMYSLNMSVDTQFPTDKSPERNYGFGGKVTLNRTEYGEFNPGFNGEFAASKTQQGYKLELDGAYNRYGNGETTFNDYMIDSKTSLEKNNDGTNLETGLYGALRFNNCRTIVEPKSVFELNKGSDGEVVKKYTNGLGIYQQVGKNFGDACIYANGARTIINGGNEKSYTQFIGGVRTRATDRLTLNAETQWKSTENWSGNIGFSYRL